MYFFFQARDGIRDSPVTGVQTCALPILPAGFEGTAKEYSHLKEHVQVWDVAAERQVQIEGKDSAKLVQLMTCRNLSSSKVGRCYYAPIIDEPGKMINDPIRLEQRSVGKVCRSRWSPHH